MAVVHEEFVRGGLERGAESRGTCHFLSGGDRTVGHEPAPWGSRRRAGTCRRAWRSPALDWLYGVWCGVVRSCGTACRTCTRRASRCGVRGLACPRATAALAAAGAVSESHGLTRLTLTPHTMWLRSAGVSWRVHPLDHRAASSYCHQDETCPRGLQHFLDA